MYVYIWSWKLLRAMEKQEILASCFEYEDTTVDPITTTAAVQVFSMNSYSINQCNTHLIESTLLFRHLTVLTNRKKNNKLSYFLCNSHRTAPPPGFKFILFFHIFQFMAGLLFIS